MITAPNRLLPEFSGAISWGDWMVMSDDRLEYAMWIADLHGCHSGWDDTYYEADAELRRRERIREIENRKR